MTKIDKVTNDKFDKIQYITLYYKCEIEGDVINNEPDKCSELQWFDWDKLPENLFLPLIKYLKI